MLPTWCKILPALKDFTNLRAFCLRVKQQKTRINHDSHTYVHASVRLIYQLSTPLRKGLLVDCVKTHQCVQLASLGLIAKLPAHLSKALLCASLAHVAHPSCPEKSSWTRRPFSKFGFEPTPPFVPRTANLHPPLSPHLQRSRRKNVKSQKLPFWRQNIFALLLSYATLCSKELLLYSFGFDQHPSSPTCVGHCQAKLYSQMLCREASYALSRLKKLEARGSSRHTVVIGHEHWSCVASCALAVQQLLQNVQYGYIEAHLRNISGRPQDKNVLALDRHWE